MAQSTIWGTAQHIGNVVRGVRWVSTACHGGLLLAPVYAKTHLPANIVEAMPFAHGYVHMEEDCDCALAMVFDHRLIAGLWPNQTDSQLDERLTNCVRAVRSYHESLVDLDEHPELTVEKSWSDVRERVRRNSRS